MSERFPADLVEKVARDICTAEWGRKEQWDWMVAKDDISLQTYRRVAIASLSATFALLRHPPRVAIEAAIEKDLSLEWLESAKAVPQIIGAFLDAINPPKE